MDINENTSMMIAGIIEVASFKNFFCDALMK